MKWIAALGFSFFCCSAFAASYSVPVPAELRPYSQFRIAPPTMAREGAKTVLQYRLPPELVGFSHAPIVMTTENYAGNSFTMTSPNGMAKCVRMGSVECNIRFRNLNINPQEVRQVLMRTSRSKAEFEGRMRVAMFFSNDPVGVLNY